MGENSKIVDLKQYKENRESLYRFLLQHQELCEGPLERLADDVTKMGFEGVLVEAMYDELDKEGLPDEDDEEVAFMLAVIDEKMDCVVLSAYVDKTGMNLYNDFFDIERKFYDWYYLLEDSTGKCGVEAFANMLIQANRARQKAIELLPQYVEPLMKIERNCER